MKKTKVVCTMGPNTNDRELLKKLIENGMDVARFNFSHGDHEEQKSSQPFNEQEYANKQNGSAERTASGIEYKHCKHCNSS